MPDRIVTPPGDAVRFSRVLRLKHLVALGSSTTVGLGVFALLGTYVQLQGLEGTAMQYVLFMLLALPIVLTYAERSGVVPGGGGAYTLARHHGVLWVTFATGWIMIGGYAALVALFGWGAALQLDIIATQLFDFSMPAGLSAALIILFVAANQRLGTSIRWRTRLAVALLGIATLIIVSVRATVWLGFSGLPDASLASHASASTAAVLMLSGLWGLYLIMGQRDVTQRPTRTILPAMLITVALGGGLGALAASAIQHYPSGTPLTLTPLIGATADSGLPFEYLIHILYAVVGTAVLGLGLNSVFVGGLKHVGVMTRDGFLPSGLKTSDNVGGAPVAPLVAFASIGVLMVVITQTVLIAVWLAVLALLWTAALVHIPDVMRKRPNLPKDRYPRLPFHPLFPGLVVAIGVLVPFVVTPPPTVLWRAALWLGIGAVVFVRYARERGLATRRQSVVVGDVLSEGDTDISDYHVMVGVADPGSAVELIEAGAKLARARSGRLFVLSTLRLPEQVAEPVKRTKAQKAWDELAVTIGELGIDDVPIKPLVRLAPTPTDGILEAVREEAVDLLVLGWTGDRPPDDLTPDSVVGPLVKSAPCDVVVVRGRLPDRLERIVVPTSGGPHAALALALAFDLAEESGEIDLVYVDAQSDDDGTEATSDERLSATMLAAGESSVTVRTQQVRANTVEEGINAVGSDADAIALGASKGGVFHSSQFGGLATRVACSATMASIIARAREKPEHPWLEPLWDIVSGPLPKLTRARRDEVTRIMHESARPSVDFFVLITLASAIAALGLLQNSAAVIIGAMLVAPLMSPILAMGMNMVLGDLRQLRIAAQATVQGVVLAIIVGVVVVVISPIDAPTNEILARTHPNVLDLMVALVSGAAAGYALSRSEVAAAMPGVAIAAALVPPLCVVGFGLGTSDFEIAAGALLLFITNLIAIILAAAIVFLALGFSPQAANRAELSRGLRITVISLAVVSVLLGVATFTSVRQINRENAASAIFTQEYVARVGEVTELTIQKTGDGYSLDATVVSYVGEDLTPEETAQLQQDISDALDGEPVSFDVTTLLARRETGSDLTSVNELATLRRMTTEEIEARSGEVVEVYATRTSSGYLVEASVITYTPELLAPSDVDDIGAVLTEAVGAPVQLRLSIMEGRLEESGGAGSASPTTEEAGSEDGATESPEATRASSPTSKPSTPTAVTPIAEETDEATTDPEPSRPIETPDTTDSPSTEPVTEPPPGPNGTPTDVPPGVPSDEPPIVPTSESP